MQARPGRPSEGADSPRALTHSGGRAATPRRQAGPSRPGGLAIELVGTESPLGEADPKQEINTERVLLELQSAPDGDLGCVGMAGVEVLVRTLGVYWGTAGG